MQLAEHWPMIVAHFETAMKTSRHLSFASADHVGRPHVTPIGSLILRPDCSGYYFEAFTQHMADNLTQNPRISILAVNSGTGFWLKSLFRGRFATAPGIRLQGVAGKCRPATAAEQAAWQERVKGARRTKGYRLIWKDLAQVRDITFDDFEIITAGPMTSHLL